MRRRLAALPPRDRSVAGAIAILGNGAPAHVVAALAGVAVGELAPIRDALQAAGLLAPDGLRFVHGLVAAALVEDLSHTERERLHREAARMLAETDASPDAVAAHLLECGPHGDPEVTDQLVRAAADARRAGTPRSRPGISSAGCRSARRATTADGCSPTSAPSRSMPGCPTPRGACATRCASVRTRRRGSTR